MPFKNSISVYLPTLSDWGLNTVKYRWNPASRAGPGDSPPARSCRTRAQCLVMPDDLWSISSASPINYYTCMPVQGDLHDQGQLAHLRNICLARPSVLSQSPNNIFRWLDLIAISPDRAQCTVLGPTPLHKSTPLDICSVLSEWSPCTQAPYLIAASMFSPRDLSTWSPCKKAPPPWLLFWLDLCAWSPCTQAPSPESCFV